VRTLVLVVLLCSLAVADTTTLQPPVRRSQIGDVTWLEPLDPRPRVALVLSGGGARGFAHLGVLAAWEDAGLPLDYIVGTSIGGTLGGLFAAGYSADSLIRIARSTDWRGFLSNQPPRRSLFVSRRKEKDEALIELHFDDFTPKVPTALSAGQSLSDFLSSLTRSADYRIEGDFDRLPIPLRVVATDLVSGQREVIGSGNLVDALRSTLAVPLAFTPWESEGKLLADGGLLDPIPVDVARDMGADIVVAVDVTSPLLPLEDLNDPFTLANQATTIMVLKRQREQLALADLVVAPDLAESENTDFEDLDSLVARGRAATAPVLDLLDSLLRVRDPAPDSADSVLSWRIVGSEGASLLAVGYGERVSSQELTDVLVARVESAWLREARVDVVSLSDSARLVWHVEEVASIRRVEFEGNALISSDSLSRAFRPLLNTQFDGPGLHNALDEILAVYQQQGYPLVTIGSATLSDDGVLVVAIDEAPVTDVTIEGTHRTKDGLVFSYMPDLVGRPLAEEDLERGISSLYATDLFESVTARTVRTAAGSEVQLRFKETEYTRLRLGLHWHEEFHAEGFAELADINIFGMGHKAAIFGMYGERRKHYALNASNDRLFNSYLAYRFSLYHRRNQWRLYTFTHALPFSLRFNRTGARFALGQQLRRFGLLSAGLRAEGVDEFVEPGFSFREYAIRSLYVEAVLDTYDRYPIPRTGYRQRIQLEHAQDVLGGSVTYTRFNADLEGIIPLRHKHVIILGLRAGTADTRLPLSEQFLMGGRYNFMGWRIGEGRGDHYWNGRIIIRLHNGGPRYITLQYNLGNIWQNEERIDLLDVDHGVGIAYTIDTPAGPLDFALAIAEKRPLIGYVNLGLRF